MTASEPLSLDEEYAMQLSWKEDDKKCTFIILGLEMGEGRGEGEEGGGREGTGRVGGREGEGEGGERRAEGGEAEEPAMAGDVNLFFNDYDDPGMCEVEVMVAEPRWRRKGLAKEAVLMLMRYGELVPAVNMVNPVSTEATFLGSIYLELAGNVFLQWSKG